MRKGPIRLKVQLFCEGEAAFGPGRAALLEAIDATGSISAAGRATGISYRKSWLMVDGMNRCFTDRLVEADNRGARLTDTGRAVLSAFRRMETRMIDATASDAAALAALLRSAPLPAD